MYGMLENHSVSAKAEWTNAFFINRIVAKKEQLFRWTHGNYDH